MAKTKAKKTVPSKLQSRSVLSGIQGGVKTVQHDVEAVLKRARREVVGLFRDQRRAVEGVVKEAKQLRRDFEKLVKEASKDLQVRPKELLATLEKEVEKRFGPILQRMVGPTRKDFQSLSRRVHALEQLMKEHAHTEAPAART